MGETTEIHRDLVKRFGRLQSDRTTVQTMWEAIERFITPYRGKMFTDQRSEHTIDWFNSRQIYDATAVMAHKNLSASIHGSLTSPTMQWFDMRFRSAKLNEDKASIKWLQEASQLVHFELQDSNFDLEVNKVYQDLCGWGTAIMTLEEGPQGDWGGLDFTAVPIKEAFFEEDHKGRVLRFYRKLQWTPAQMISKFGAEGVPKTINDAEKAGTGQKRDVLFCIYPRNNTVMKWGEKLAGDLRPWAYCYILLNSKEPLGEDGGYYDMPAFAPRWDVTNSSQWGHSPAMDALADVLSLNQLVKDDLRAIAKMVDPAMMAEERSIYTDLNMDPGTLTVVRSINGVGPVPGPTSQSMMATDSRIDRLQGNIRSYFLTDRIDFPDMQPQPMTATEAQIRYERMQRYLGATLAHLRNDMLNPTIERSFRMLVREKRIEQPPEIVIKEGGNLDIIYLGSLARAQQVDEVAAIERTMMSAANMAEVYPDGLEVIDSQKAIRAIGRKLNAPADIMRDEKELKKRAKKKAQEQAAMAEAEMARMEGEAAQAIGAGEQAINDQQQQQTAPA